MTHNCIKCDTHLVIDENWHESRKVAKHYICKYCHATACNDKRMFVNGKYVSTSHPLYKAGNYKTFDDYTLVHYAYSDDRNVAERQAHVLAGKLGDRRNEWFKINNEDAVIVIEQAVAEEMEIA